jgi:hypothetical protein
MMSIPTEDDGMEKTAKGWSYTGDVNPVYGGVYIKVDPKEYRWGYLEAVEVTDLASACGAPGMILVEAFTVVIDRQGKSRHYVRKALESCGVGVHEAARLFWKDREAFMYEVARACMSYGRRDPRQPAHMWDDTPQSMVVQTERGEPMEWDGWKAEKFIDPKDLSGFVAATWLD